jgi:hypothetical protein
MEILPCSFASDTRDLKSLCRIGVIDQHSHCRRHLIFGKTYRTAEGLRLNGKIHDGDACG